MSAILFTSSASCTVFNMSLDEFNLGVGGPARQTKGVWSAVPRLGRDHGESVSERQPNQARLHKHCPTTVQAHTRGVFGKGEAARGERVLPELAILCNRPL